MSGRILLALVLAAFTPLAALAQTPAPSPTPPPAPAPAPAPAPPAPPERKAAFVLELGGDFGSNELLKLEFSDGSDATMKLNDGFWMAAGAAFLRTQLGAEVSIDTAATIGFKYKSIGADDGSFRYLAFPLELTERLWLGPIRFAAGVSLALNPSFKGDGVLGGPEYDLELDNSLGIVLRADFVGKRETNPRQGYVVGIRVLLQKLAEAETDVTESANAIGFTLGVEL